MPLRFKRRLLAHLGHESYEPSQIDALADDLGVKEDDRAEFRQAVQELAAAGQVALGDDQKVRLPPLGSEVVGVFKKNPKGFGFVIPRDANAHGDLFIPPDGTSDAMTGDVVRAKVVRSRGGSRGSSAFRSAPIGQIVEVLERKRSEFVGELVKRGSQWIVLPDGKAMRDPVVVRDPTAKNAKEGDKVVFELIRRPEGTILGEGVILNVLGKSGEPDVETQAVIAAYSLPGEFPEECVEQARRAATQYDREIDEAIGKGRGFKDRLDLRDRFIITIDPPDARDFDDAIQLERVGDGWKLGVHIADVAHFIPPGSPLDAEATERGNSVYLPRHVIPMLPEVLSNGICSLQEGVPRYCKSAFIEYDSAGRVRRQGFASTLIHSAKRLTYLEAQALIDGDQTEARKHAKTEPAYTERLVSTLRDMDGLAKAILGQRMKQGMIRLQLPVANLVFDDSGRVVDVEQEDDAFTHTLIEMFMVAANEAVARLFENLDLPLLRRVHPEPIPGAMDDLREFVKVAGFRIPKNPTREELQALLESTRDTPAARAVHFAVLRSLTKAEYSPARVGHFALASDAYAHFTSPIRRYPDLTVHRALATYLGMTNNGQSPPRDEREEKRLTRDLRDAVPDEGDLVAVGRRCTGTEENAAAAENDLKTFLILQFMSDRVGEQFPGVVTGVTNTGVFVQLEKYLAEGLVKTEDLPVGQAAGRGSGPGRWKIDPRSGALVEQSSGRSFNIGDTVRVVVASVDLPARRMELLIADPGSREVGKIKKPLVALGSEGGMGHSKGAGFQGMTGGERRSRKSKSRDKRKPDWRKDRKGK